MEQPSHVALLIKKYLDGSISEQENRELQVWLNARPNRSVLLDKLNKDKELFQQVLMWIELDKGDQNPWSKKLKDLTLKKIKNTPEARKKRKTKKLLWVSSISMLVLISSIFTLKITKNQLFNPNAQYATLYSVKPGGNKAFIILPNGKIHLLREDQEKIVIQKDLKICYANGALIAKFDQANLADNILQVKVPRAGKYQVELADGTHIWMNSESLLSAPIAINTANREVLLKGEAYFQVSHLTQNGHKASFRVKSKNQIIEVLGTQFNVSAYEDDSNIRTTLVKGIVQIHAKNELLKLQPNQQAILAPDGLSKENIQIEKEIAWKNNKFLFQEMEIKQAMKLLSRWYDVEIVYRNQIPETYFYGEISRDKKLHEVLEILKASGIKFDFKSKANKKYLILGT